MREGAVPFLCAEMGLQQDQGPDQENDRCRVEIVRCSWGKPASLGSSKCVKVLYHSFVRRWGCSRIKGPIRRMIAAEVIRNITTKRISARRTDIVRRRSRGCRDPDLESRRQYRNGWC